MAEKFKYRFDRRTRLLTVMWILVGIAVTACVVICLHGSYLHAWLLSLIFAIVALYILSIPREITIDEHNLDIRCVAELTRIDVRDIRAIRKTDRKRYRMLIPLIGSYGFFGYYGYYLNLRRWDIVKVYTTNWKGLVEIRDIYEQTYVVSCEDADRFIESVMQVKLMHAGKKSQS